jgi:hypothetical protein
MGKTENRYLLIGVIILVFDLIVVAFGNIANQASQARSTFETILYVASDAVWGYLLPAVGMGFVIGWFFRRSKEATLHFFTVSSVVGVVMVLAGFALKYVDTFTTLGQVESGRQSYSLILANLVRTSAWDVLLVGAVITVLSAIALWESRNDATVTRS